MAFPETRVSLIRRIVTSGDAAFWDQFVAGYWRATCRFAMRIGNLQWNDAEDVASQVFEVIVRKSLLQSWLAKPEARFKTLLCTVVRHVVHNTVRTKQRETRKIADQIQHALDDGNIAVHEDDDLFHTIWAEELLRTSVQAVMDDYHREGKGDYFRVLYGRVCEQLSFKEIAEHLDLKITDVENFSRHARKRLANELERRVRTDIAYYTDFAEIDAEFRREWQNLADLLQRRGGLETALRNSMSANEL